jgi:hypothetical protein
LIKDNPLDLYKDSPYDEDSMSKTEVKEILEQSNKEEFESLNIAGLMDKKYFEADADAPSKQFFKILKTIKNLTLGFCQIFMKTLKRDESIISIKTMNFMGVRFINVLKIQSDRLHLYVLEVVTLLDMLLFIKTKPYT